jgi:hypothetical protein
MPERICAIFANLPAERERVLRMFRDAGLFEQLTKTVPSDQLLYTVELPPRHDPGPDGRGTAVRALRTRRMVRYHRRSIHSDVSRIHAEHHARCRMDV